MTSDDRDSRRPPAPAVPDLPERADVPDPSRYRQGLRCLHDYLRLHARAQPDKPAFIWYGRAIGYLELDRWSDALAVRLAQSSAPTTATCCRPRPRSPCPTT